MSLPNRTWKARAQEERKGNEIIWACDQVMRITSWKCDMDNFKTESKNFYYNNK